MQRIASPDGLAAVHPCTLSALEATGAYMYICSDESIQAGIKGQHAFNIHANYSSYVAIQR